jgi:hypothetical protein
MSTHSVSEVIDRDRRHLLSNAAMGIAAVTAASLLPAFPSHAAASTEIRPFHMNFPEEALIDLRRRVSGTEAAVTLDPDGQGFKISKSALTLRGSVPNLDDAGFARIAGEAEKNYPVSKVLNAAITLDAKLV